MKARPPTKNAEKLRDELLANTRDTVDKFFDSKGPLFIQIVPSYSLGAVTDFFDILETLFDNGRTMENKRELVKQIEESRGHSGNTWSYIMHWVRDFYPEQWKIIKEDWSYYDKNSNPSQE